MGGVAGHMAHLSEDLELKFNDIVDILGKVANAEINNATEKVDGQNLFLSVDSKGEIRTARNNGDVKKGGMTTEEYISKWRGHPAENAFTNGFKAVSAALRQLSPAELESIFAGGRRYVNMEIMYPNNPNIILYDSPNIVLHSLKYFGETDETPEERRITKQKFTKLARLIDGESLDVGNEQWRINGPKIVALTKLADGKALEDVSNKIENFAAPVGMDATLGDYVEEVVREYVSKYDFPADIVDDLVLLMIEPDEAKSRGISANDLKKRLPADGLFGDSEVDRKTKQAIISKLGTKTNSRKYISHVLRPLSDAISDFAIEVLRGVKSFFVGDNDREVMRMRDELNKSISHLKSLQATGDEKMGELVDQQLAKLGDIENVASSMEGIVFEYPPGSDKLYKLTGAFAMTNQIIGRARRSGMTEEEIIELDIIEDETDDPVVDTDYPKTIAVVPGAFKPPHKGHLDMVRSYANIADEVIVIISKPTKSGRKLPNGREITSEDSLKIWNVLLKGLPNVEVTVSKDHASPINAAYEYVGDEGPLNTGDKVILGCSNKGGDCKRWAGAEKYIKDGVELLPITGVEPTVRDNGEPYSATDFRNALGTALEDRSGIGEFVGDDNIEAVLGILGLGNVEEMSAMAGGAAAGYAGPLGSTPGKRRKRVPANRLVRHENIDLNIVDEVMKLIMKRGI